MSQTENEKETRQRTKSNESESGDESPSFEYKPVITLPLIEVNTHEENEKELFKVRARLYRYDRQDDPPSWKERGTGDVKILLNEDNNRTRLLMRRDKTLKLCANHYITTAMELKNHGNNERAFMWSTLADFADETSKAELLCIRFGNVENAQKFKETFEEAQEYAKKFENKECSDDEEEDDLKKKFENVHLSKSCDKETKDKHEANDDDDEEDDEEEEDESENSEKDENEKENSRK